VLTNPISTSNWLNTHRYTRQLLECWFLAWCESIPTLLTCLTMQAVALADGDWSSCDSRHLTTAVWKSTIRDKLKNNINHIIQHQNSQAIKKIFAGKKQNAKKLKSVQNVLDNPEPDPAWAKMTSNPAPDPINLIILPDRTPKIRVRNNTDPNAFKICDGMRVSEVIF